MEKTKKEKAQVSEPLENNNAKRQKISPISPLEKKHKAHHAPHGFITTSSEMFEGLEKYVTYQVGNGPIVITVPHGGTLTPTHIPDRKSGCIVPDTSTIELGHAVARDLEIKTKFRPHLIILHLHRSKLDGNRPCKKAGEEGEARLIWDLYHTRIRESLCTAHKEFGFTHVFDIHGQSHRTQTEVGYSLNNSRLRSFKELGPRKMIAKSSLRGLARRIEKENNNEAIWNDLIRGSHSMGELLESQGYACVPSPKMPHPCKEDSEHTCWKWEGDDEPTDPCTYFWGGFSTAYYSHCFLSQLVGGSKIQADILKTCCNVTQLETAAQPRESEEGINKFGQAISSAITDFVEYWYKFELKSTKVPEETSKI